MSTRESLGTARARTNAVKPFSTWTMAHFLLVELHVHFGLLPFVEDEHLIFPVQLLHLLLNVDRHLVEIDIGDPVDHLTDLCAGGRRETRVTLVQGYFAKRRFDCIELKAKTNGLLPLLSQTISRQITHVRTYPFVQCILEGEKTSAMGLSQFRISVDDR